MQFAKFNKMVAAAGAELLPYRMKLHPVSAFTRAAIGKAAVSLLSGEGLGFGAAAPSKNLLSMLFYALHGTSLPFSLNTGIAAFSAKMAVDASPLMMYIY